MTELKIAVQNLERIISNANYLALILYSNTWQRKRKLGCFISLRPGMLFSRYNGHHKIEHARRKFLCIIRFREKIGLLNSYFRVSIFFSTEVLMKCIYKQSLFFRVSCNLLVLNIFNERETYINNSSTFECHIFTALEKLYGI